MSAPPVLTALPVIRQAAMQYEERDVTPEQAQTWLDAAIAAGIKNRPVNRKRVRMYARQMRNGLWCMTGEPIRFDEDGLLLNGQHRLLAVVACGLTVRFSLLWGVLRSTLKRGDTGMSKRSGDWSEWANARAAHAIVGVALALGNRGAEKAWDDTDRETAYHALGADHVQWAIGSMFGNAISHATPVRLAGVIVRRHSATRADEFARRLNTMSAPERSPEAALLRAMVNQRANRHARSLLAVRAALSVLRGAECGLLRPATPEMIDETFALVALDLKVKS